MTVSVIMPTYNRAHTLPIAIGSVLNQTFADWELLIVDDGSTDNTESVVNQFAAEDRRIKYVPLNQNSGVSTARNKGIEEATGEYISYLDSDNYMYPDWLENMTNFLEHHRDVSWLFPRLNTSILDHSREETRILTETLIPDRDVGIEDLWSMHFQADPNGLVHKKSLLTNKIRWDESIQSYGDYEYALQLSRLDPNGFAVHPFALGRYIRIYGANGMCSNRGYKEIISGLVYMQKKHSDFPEWSERNGIPKRIERYTECLDKNMKPIDGLRRKYGELDG